MLAVFWMGLKYEDAQGTWNWERNGQQAATTPGTGEWMTDNPGNSGYEFALLFTGHGMSSGTYTVQAGYICELW